MSLGRLEKGDRATDVCEVLLQHALGQTCQKELRQEETKESYNKAVQRGCKCYLSKYLGREEKEGRNMGVMSPGDLYPSLDL